MTKSSFKTAGVIACAVAVIFSASCRDSTEPVVPYVGDYVLRTYNGQPVPVMLSSADSMLGADLVIRADESFTLNPRYRRGAGTPWTTTIAGRVTRTGTSLSYANQTGQIATGKVTNGYVTFEQTGVSRFQHR